MPGQAFSIEPIAGALGAEVHHIDLTQPLDDDTFTRLHDALCEHLVLFFRRQHISPAQHKALGERFGTLQVHEAYPHPDGFPEVTILEHSAEKPSKIEAWHTDMTFRPQPPLGSILHAQIVPKIGGDTMWSSLIAAYEGLSTSMKRLLDDLHAVHDFRHGFRESLAEPGGTERLKPMLEAYPPITHPLIRTHPVTKRKAIFVNTLFTTHIVGLPPRENKSLLDFLYDHITQPEYTCRFRWETHAIAFWDNRATLHKPVNDHGLAHRVMHRVTIEGEAPF